MARNNSENTPVIKCPSCDSEKEVGVVAPAFIWFDAEVAGTTITYNRNNSEVEENSRGEFRLECAACGRRFEKPDGFRIISR